MKAIHIIPESDTHPHIASSLCPCLMNTILEEHAIILVHEAYDKRDVVEAAVLNTGVTFEGNKPWIIIELDL